MSFVPNGNTSSGTGLTQFYDNLKGDLDKGSSPGGPQMMRVSPGMGHEMRNHPGAFAWSQMASKHCDHLKDD